MPALKSPPAHKNTGIEARCAATGMRMTEQRRVIARVLADSVDHPDVEELYRRCVAVDDKISISTVYRTVKLFEDAGIIERHDFREGRARYEQMPDSHHDHLINLRDGKVIEFTSEEIEKLQAEIARKLGYKLVDHRLELYCVPLDDENPSFREPLIVNFDLIIFDCDGVLVDSEVISCRAHAEALTRHGYPITPQQVFDRFLGRSTRQANSEVEAELGRALPDDFHAQVQDELFRSFEADLRSGAAYSRGARCDRAAGLRRLERLAAAHERHARPRPGFTTGLRRTSSRPRRSARQARARSVSVCRRTDEGRAGALPRDRGQRARRHRRPRRRDDRARLSRRQPLPPRPRPTTLRAAGAAVTFDDMRQLPESDRADWGCGGVN